MNLRSQKRMAAKLLGVGTGRVKIDPESLEDVSRAITRDDIRFYINNNLITAKQKKGVSKGRLRHKKKQKNLGRRRGHGHRSGTLNARNNSKRRWINKIRALRKELRRLKSEGEINESEYRRLYLQAKGNLFNSRRHLREHIERMHKK
ncbi:MAG: 50S ribosomal protein L19e [Candidatus Altiarchaeales archaeon ex4484_96]|nr:MAG: 50S ribosomal protein L19e [Candidatus Altiarchaeales archaeon ex4484_96]